MTMETFAHQRSHSAPPSMVYPPLRTDSTNTKWKPTESDVHRCFHSDERTDASKQLIEFYFHSQPRPSLFISSDSKCSSANYKAAAAVSSFNQVISLYPNNSVEHALHGSTDKPHANVFSRFAKPCSIFFAKMLQVRYFVIRCEAKFSYKCHLRF